MEAEKIAKVMPYFCSVIMKLRVRVTVMSVMVQIRNFAVRGMIHFVQKQRKLPPKRRLLLLAQHLCQQLLLTLPLFPPLPLILRHKLPVLLIKRTVSTSATPLNLRSPHLADLVKTVYASVMKVVTKMGKGVALDEIYIAHSQHRLALQRRQ